MEDGTQTVEAPLYYLEVLNEVLGYTVVFDALDPAIEAVVALGLDRDDVYAALDWLENTTHA